MTTRTVFIGTGEFGVPALRVVAARPDIDLVGVVTAPPRPAGRRGEVRGPPIHDAAAELGLAVLTPERLRSTEALDAVLALRPDLVILADYGQIVPPALLGVRHGALNLHPSLLPRHRGAIPIPAAILAGDETTGVSLMRMDAGLDTGPIVGVEEMRLRGDEVAPDLERRLAEAGAGLLDRALEGWLAGALEPAPQPATGATLTRPLQRDDGWLDPGCSTAALERQVRAFRPWPGSWIELPGGRLTVWRAHLGPASAPEPGRLRIVDGLPALSVADGTLVLDEVQPAGGRRMAGAEFARGRHGLETMVMPGPSRQPFERPVG